MASSVGFRLSLPCPGTSSSAYCVGGNWLSRLEVMSAPHLEAGRQPRKAGQCGLSPPAFPSHSTKMLGANHPPSRFKVANGAPSCPLARAGPRGVHASLAPWRSQRGRGWGMGAGARCCSFQNFLLNGSDWWLTCLCGRKETNALLLPLHSFILEKFPPCAVLENSFHKLLVLPALLINAFPVSPQSHICMKQGCSTGFERKVMLPNTLFHSKF